jgi:hypothetical protein
MKSISKGGISKVDVEKSFVGGCPKLDWAKKGYEASGKKKASKPKAKRSTSKPKPKAKRATSKPKPKAKRATSKKRVVRRRRGGATEAEVEENIMGALPVVGLLAKYGPGEATVERLGLNDNQVQMLREDFARRANIGKPTSVKNTIYDKDLPKPKGKSPNGANDADDAEDAEDVGDDLEDVGADAEDIFADGAELLGLGKKKKKAIKKKASKKKSTKKKSTKKKSTKKKSTKRKKSTKKKSTKKKTATKKKKGGAKKKTTKKKKGGAKKKTTKKKTTKKKTTKKRAVTKKRTTKKRTTKGKNGKKGGSFQSFFEGIWNGLKGANEWETNQGSYNSANMPRGQTYNQELRSLEVTGTSPQEARKLVPVPSGRIAPLMTQAPKQSNNSYLFGGSDKKKKERNSETVRAETEMRGAKRRFETEMKEYLNDYRYQAIDTYQPDKKNKDQMKYINEMVADERIGITDAFKRFSAEALTNVYTEMFNRVRNSRPQFSKYNNV